MLPFFSHAQSVSQTLTAQVAEVKDGDSFVLTTGQGVRLLDINTPEGPREGTPAEPYADDARSTLKSLIEGKTITLATGRKSTDKYGRLLAHATVDNTWVNGEMVKRGLAIAYTFADNRERADDILKLEQTARTTNTGLWSHPRWAVKSATTCCTPEELGRFQIIQGKVISTGRDKDSLYLNFGLDYRTDVTARILYKDMKWFRERNVDKPEEYYLNKTVRLHGMAAPVYGVLVNVSHPEQIEVLDAKGNMVPYPPRTEPKPKSKAKPKKKKES
jgi:micrococcal nuclease